MYDSSNASNTPHFPGKIWIKSHQTNIAGYYADDTPENRTVKHMQDMQAAMAGVSPKGDYATVSDFRQQFPRNQTAETFAQFCALHQCSPRHAIQLEIEASAQGLDLSATTFQPNVMADDPLKREAIPMATEDEGDFDPDDSAYPPVSDGDLDHVKVPGNISLRRLQRAGLVSRSMSPEAFSARLERIGVTGSDSLRKSVLASMCSFFKANGSQWGPPAQQPLTLEPGRVANLNAQRDSGVRQVLKEVQEDVRKLLALVQRKRSERELTGRR